jgi:hypothetical protein
MLLRNIRALLRYRQRRLRFNEGAAVDRDDALREAVLWLCRSQEAGPDDGSSCFHLASGWSAGYPEVTGYILYTLLRYYRLTGDREVYEHAMRMADWELSVQLPNGAFQGGYVSTQREPVVFNTAQVLQGLIRVHGTAGDNRYLNAACHAADWLVEIQDDDGAWRKHVYLGKFRVTDTRVTFPLLQLWRTTGDRQYQNAAVRSLDFVVGLQQKNGWFPLCDNSTAQVNTPLVHTLAYTCEGLLKSGLILKEMKYVEAARRTADAMLRRFEVHKVLLGRFDSRWRATVNWVCLTGCAQMSEVWSLLSLYFNDVWYLNAALRMNDYLCTIQDLTTPLLGIKGAMPGSEPLWGGYHPYAFPSWGTKYFCDALIAEEEAFQRVVLGQDAIQVSNLEELL